MSECVQKIIKVIIIKNVIITVILIIGLSIIQNALSELIYTRVFYNHRKEKKLILLNVHHFK